ncbi:MAG: hypothetical protein ABI596_16830 [Pyrinomonadaceae bacterium]
MKLVRASNLEGDVDALFRLPLAEFTGARNELAARLKKIGRGDEAVRMKGLVKPPVSAWAVNQLYWNHREAFDQLIASGERFHKAQKSGKMADMRTALDARRGALADLSDLATSLLRDAGHNPSLDTIRRVTSTLEAMSVYASRSDAPRPGRLTEDVDPPGFESFGSFGSFVPRTGMTKTAKEPSRFTSVQKSSSVTTTARGKVAAGRDIHKPEEARKTKIAAARVSLQDAKRSLTQARSHAQSLEAAQKKADAEAKKAEKQLRQAEDNLKKAKAASEDAVRSARSLAAEVEEAASGTENAELTVEKASRELEKLFAESSLR